MSSTPVVYFSSKQDSRFSHTADIIKAQNANEVSKRAAAVMNELKETKQSLEKAESKLAGSKLDDILNNAQVIDNIKIATARLDGVSADELRKMTDTAKAENGNIVIVLAAVNGEKLTFCAACGKDAISSGCHAGNLVREIAKLAGGNGGGKPDSAMAGGKDVSKADEALSAVCDIVKGQLK